MGTGRGQVQFFREGDIADFQTTSDNRLTGMKKELARLKGRQSRFGQQVGKLKIDQLRKDIEKRETELFEGSEEFAALTKERADIEAEGGFSALAALDARGTSKKLGSTRGVGITSIGGVDVDTNKIKRLLSGAPLAGDDEIDRIEGESDDEFKVRSARTAEEIAKQQINREFNRQMDQIEESFASFADPNTGRINPNAARRMGETMREVEKRRADMLSDREKKFKLNLESIIRSLPDDADLEKKQRQSLMEAEVAGLADQLVREQGLPLTTATLKAKDMLAYKESKPQTAAEKIDDLNSLESSFGIDRQNAASTVFNKLRSFEDTEEYMTDVLGMGIGDAKDQIRSVRLALNPHLTEDMIRQEEASESQAEQQSEFLQGEIRGIGLGTFLDMSEASKAPEAFGRMLDVAINSGVYDGTIEEQLIRSRRDALGLQEKPDFEQSKFEFQVSKEFEDASSGFLDTQAAFGRIHSVADSATAAGDLALIFNFMKMLDPGSVVRESEFRSAEQAKSWLARTEKDGLVIPSSVKTAIQKADPDQSGAFLLPSQRQDFLSQARNIYDSNVDSQVRRQDQFGEQIILFGGRKEVLRDLISPELTDPEGAQSDDAAVDMIKQFEGFRAEAYLDQAGVPTIGFGTTTIGGNPVKIGDSISRKDAEKELKKQISTYKTWQNSVTTDLTTEQQASLTSFTYNLGAGIWDTEGGERLSELINAGNFDKAIDLIERFDKFRNPETGELEKSAGLSKRREKESSSFKNA
jgi:GH24 family phage-related lysozyme (muramidase)